MLLGKSTAEARRTRRSAEKISCGAAASGTRTSSSAGLRVLCVSVVVSSACASAPRAHTPELVFRNNFWVNLHHFVRAEARREAYGADPVLAVDGLSDEERADWRAALDAYRGIAQRPLLFDEELVRINVALAEVPDVDSLPDGWVDPELTLALNRAAPIYRVRLWPGFERRNAGWIARTRAAVEPHWPALAAALASAYRTEWPADPILVDVTPETGRAVAYTTQAAPRGFGGLVTIAPLEELAEPALAELLAHEVSHVVDHVLVDWIVAESARQGVAPPPDLWHALLTQTAGVVSARELGASGTFEEDLARDFPAYVPALERHWLGYLEGTLPFERALHDLVAATTSPSGE